jgi:hypothetical protein
MTRERLCSIDANMQFSGLRGTKGASPREAPIAIHPGVSEMYEKSVILQVIASTA